MMYEEDCSLISQESRREHINAVTFTDPARLNELFEFYEATNRYIYDCGESGDTEQEKRFKRFIYDPIAVIETVVEYERTMREKAEMEDQAAFDKYCEDNYPYEPEDELAEEEPFIRTKVVTNAAAEIMDKELYSIDCDCYSVDEYDEYDEYEDEYDEYEDEYDEYEESVYHEALASWEREIFRLN